MSKQPEEVGHDIRVTGERHVFNFNSSVKNLDFGVTLQEHNRPRATVSLTMSVASHSEDWQNEFLIILASCPDFCQQ